MATIYDMDAMELTCGLQGSVVCDEAIQCARRMAADREESVILEDDDVLYQVDTDGTITEVDPADIGFEVAS